MLELRWSGRAKRQLDSALDYISDHNRSAAVELRRVIDAGVDTLCQHPGLGRPGRVKNTREWVATPNYLVVYRVTPATLDILRILHARQRYP